MGVANISGNILTDSGASLSSYLPLTGGTLTGALIGTTGTFSGQLTASTSRVNGRLFTTSDASFGDMLSTTGVLAISYDAAGQTGYITSRNYTTSTNTPLVFTSSAATFTSSVGIGATAGTNGLFEVSNLGAGVTVGDFLVDAANKNVYVGRLSSTSNDNTNFIVRNRIGTAALYVQGNTGNVGIGTTTPDCLLQARGLDSLSANTRYLKTHVGGAGTWGVNSFEELGIGYSGIRSIYTSGDNWDLAFSAGTSSTFTSGTQQERMRILSNGAVCIGRTSGDGKLNIDGTVYLYNTSSGAGNSTLKYNTSTGQVTFDTSARVFKKDITDLEYGLDAVLKMSSKKYKWKYNNQEDLGFIADEMYKVVPEVVFLADSKINTSELKDGEPMGINYDRLIPVLVKAVQELSAKVTALEQKA